MTAPKNRRNLGLNAAQCTALLALAASQPGFCQQLLTAPEQTVREHLGASLDAAARAELTRHRQTLIERQRRNDAVLIAGGTIPFIIQESGGGDPRDGEAPAPARDADANHPQETPAPDQNTDSRRRPAAAPMLV